MSVSDCDERYFLKVFVCLFQFVPVMLCFFLENSHFLADMTQSGSC